MYKNYKISAVNVGDQKELYSGEKKIQVGLKIGEEWYNGLVDDKLIPFFYSLRQDDVLELSLTIDDRGGKVYRNFNYFEKAQVCMLHLINARLNRACGLGLDKGEPEVKESGVKKTPKTQETTEQKVDKKTQEDKSNDLPF
jgi:hypothetical protein